MDQFYSIENAQKYGWASITGDLNPERLYYLSNLLEGKKILDAGCSGGGYTDFVASRGYSVTGVDKFAEFLSIARNRNSSSNYVQGDITDLPFESKSFDCTYCFDVLEHVDDEAAIQELARVTTKRLITVVPLKDETFGALYGLTFIQYTDPTHLRYYTEDSFRKLISIIKPSRIDTYFHGFIPFKQLIENMLLESQDESTPIDYEPSIYLRALKSTAKDLRNRKLPNMQASYNKALKTLFLKVLHKISIKQVPTELISVIDLAP
ncbi:MAG: class I SAM-dependent methyltransferase [Pyrinomonadaceae bacterium MAG19_C2-C3]|nr:class I SAM-dependent methyltransferase [Pyrinomonadaceae bacterium MAG19_C2-C3]